MIDSFENLPRPRTDIYSKLGMSVHPVVCCPNSTSEEIEAADKEERPLSTLPPKVNLKFQNPILQSTNWPEF